MRAQTSLNDTEIKINGIDVLNKELGPSNAHRFLTLLNREPTDYVEISRKLYKNQTIADIFKRAKENWK